MENRKSLTMWLGQEVFDEFCMVSYMQDAVHTGVHQLFLIIPQVLCHVLWHKHDVPLHVHHEEETV